MFPLRSRLDASLSKAMITTGISRVINSRRLRIVSDCRPSGLGGAPLKGLASAVCPLLSWLSIAIVRGRDIGFVTRRRACPQSMMGMLVFFYHVNELPQDVKLRNICMPVY